jgi:hypothetical protein
VSDACLRLLAQGGSIRINKLAAVNDLARQSRAPCGRNYFDCGIDRVFNKQHSVVFARVKRGGMVTCGLGNDWVQKSRRSLDARFKSREDRNCRRSSNILDDVTKSHSNEVPSNEWHS